MVIPALILATGVALPLHTAGPLAEGHWATAIAVAGTHRRHLSAGTHGHQGGHPAESGRPRARARHAMRPAATHKTLRQMKDSAWVLVVRPQHRRLTPHVAPAQRAMLEPGLLLHVTGERRPGWLRVYDSINKSWVAVGNVRPAGEPVNWARTVVHLHPQLQRRRAALPTPRVSHLPLPATGAAAVLPAAPVATPAPAPQPAAPQQVVQVVQVVQPAPVVRTPVQSVYFWAGQYGVNGDLLLRTAECESGLNSAAYNPSGASGGLQFMPSTFAAYSAQLQWDHVPSYWNFDDSARVAAYMWSQGQQGQWSCWYVTTQGYNPDNG